MNEFLNHLLVQHYLMPMNTALMSFLKKHLANLTTKPFIVKPLSIRVCEFKPLPYSPEIFDEKDQTAKLFGMEDAPSKANFMIVPIRSNISKIDLNLKDNPVFVRCPRMPADLNAKIGCRRSKHNPDKTEKVFGFHVIISTTIEPELNLELPIACITKPGNSKDGNYLIPLKEQVKLHPSLLAWRHTSLLLDQN